VKPSCRSVQQDLISKLQRFDFALNDVDNNGCRSECADAQVGFGQYGSVYELDMSCVLPVSMPGMQQRHMRVSMQLSGGY
jgi:hypothetical protein